MEVSEIVSSNCGSSPSVFLSYRRQDANAVSLLAENLREDLGRDNVFRDTDDLVGGTEWQTELERRISWATSVLVLMGDHWERAESSESPDDDVVDFVRWEVQCALSSDQPDKAVPVLVDRPMPDDLPPDISQLKNRHAVAVRSESLSSPEESDYPRVLAAVWNSLKASVPNGVLVVADRGAHVQLENFVRSLQTAKLIDAKFLSQFGSSTCLISPRTVRRKAKEWPNAIVLTDDDQVSPFLTGVVRALDAHPGFARVAVVGGGAVVAGVSAGVTATTLNGFTSSIPAAGHAAGGVAGMSVGAKVGLGMGVGALAVGGAAAAAVLIDDDETSALEFPDSATLVSASDSEGAFPLGDPVEIEVELGEAVDTNESGDIPPDAAEGFVQRSVTASIEGVEEPVLIDDIVIPTVMRNDLIANQGDAFRVATVETDISELIDEIAVAEYCYRIPDQSDVIGGWAYTGETGTLEITFVANVENGKLAGTNIVAVTEGAAQREMFASDSEDLDLSQCPEQKTAENVWADD